MADASCYSCAIFDAFNQKTLSFSQAFFDAVTPELKTLLSYLFTLWINPLNRYFCI